MATARGFELINNGAFVVSIHAIYTDSAGDQQDTPISGNFPLGTTETATLEKCAITPNDWVQLGIWVQAGDDRTGSPNFRYDPNGPIQAYSISGTTLDSTVTYIGSR